MGKLISGSSQRGWVCVMGSKTYPINLEAFFSYCTLVLIPEHAIVSKIGPRRFSDHQPRNGCFDNDLDPVSHALWWEALFSIEFPLEGL